MTSPRSSRDASFSRVLPMLRISFVDSAADSSSISLLRFIPRFRVLDCLGELSEASAWTCVCVGSQVADSGGGLTGHCSDLAESSWGKLVQVSPLCSSEAESDSTAWEWSLKYEKESKVSTSSVSLDKTILNNVDISEFEGRSSTQLLKISLLMQTEMENNLVTFWLHEDLIKSFFFFKLAVSRSERRFRFQKFTYHDI